MKILIVEDIGFEPGGVQSYLINLKKELKKEGHTIKILSSDVNPEKKHFSDYKFRSFNKNRITRYFLHIFNPFSYFKIKQILKKFKPDIIHLNNFLNLASPSILCCLKNIPVIMTLHGYGIVCPVGYRMLPSLEICKLTYGNPFLNRTYCLVCNSC